MIVQFCRTISTAQIEITNASQSSLILCKYDLKKIKYSHRGVGNCFKYFYQRRHLVSILDVFPR